MWTVVYIAPSMQAAGRVKQVLEEEGLLVNVRPLETDTDGRGSVEILVPDGEAEEAHEVLASHLGRMR